MLKKYGIAGVALALVLAGLIAGLVISSRFDLQTDGITKENPKDNRAAGAEISPASIKFLEQLSNALQDVVAVVRPSVVNISTEKRVTRGGGGGMSPLWNDPFFRQFEELFRQPEAPRGGQREEQAPASLGSGVLVDPKGFIITNYHVVKDADSIKVTLSDKREYAGKVIGADPKTDIVVIKIEAEGPLPSVQWGDSDKLRVGEMVIAVGSPYGLAQTVTSGIVSAKGRANVRIADYEDFIQTDAAINPGNSGGPLINVRGELVGINTAIFSTSGGYQGIGFSIPSNMVRTVMDSLIKSGKVVRGWLGVSIQGIDKSLAKQFKLDSQKGALVSDVLDDSPADKSGLKRGDIIVEFNGKPVEDQTELRNMVAATAPDTKVNVGAIRDGKRIDLTVTIGELPSEQAATSGEYDNALAGISVQDITPDIRRQLEIPRKVKGVIVSDAAPATGLKRGDVIVELNRTPLENVKDYDRIASSIGPRDSVLLLVYREGHVIYLTLRGD